MYRNARGRLRAGQTGEGSGELPDTGLLSEVRDLRPLPPFFGWAVFSTTVAQIGGRDYAEVGAANAQEVGKVRYIGHVRGWAAVAAIILVIFGVLSWTNPLYVSLFLIGSAACALLALGLQLARPVVDPE